MSLPVAVEVKEEEEKEEEEVEINYSRREIFTGHLLFSFIEFVFFVIGNLVHYFISSIKFDEPYHDWLLFWITIGKRGLLFLFMIQWICATVSIFFKKVNDDLEMRFFAFLFCFWVIQLVFPIAFIGLIGLYNSETIAEFMIGTPLKFGT